MIYSNDISPGPMISPHVVGETLRSAAPWRGVSWQAGAEWKPPGPCVGRWHRMAAGGFARHRLGEKRRQFPGLDGDLGDFSRS